MIIAISAFLAQRALRVAPVRLRWHQRILTLPCWACCRALSYGAVLIALRFWWALECRCSRSLQAAGETITNLAMRNRVMDAVQRVREGSHWPKHCEPMPTRKKNRALEALSSVLILNLIS